MSSKRGRGRGRRPKGTVINDESTLLPGRRECCCEASKHQLVANCLSCGRVVCAQEGSGVCFTCGQLVLTRADRQSLMADNNQSQQILEELSSKGISAEMLVESGLKAPSNVSNTGLKNIAASIETAVRHKDQMLEFDRNSSVRTKVIDDENDYFSLGSQNWISNEKRRTISAKVNELHENKLKTNKKILIDLIGKSATDYSEPVVKDFDQQIQELHNESKLKSDYQSVNASQFIDEDNLQKSLPVLEYINNGSKNRDQLSEDLKVTKRLINSYNSLKVQDKELMTMSDEGMCLSVAQPFASLLVCGIKRFEGRNWYSVFRGRLWIQSNSKTPNEESIKRIEKFYSFAGIKTFPASYPTSALVGCVTVTDCLPFDEFRERYPDGETEDNYIFVCEDPKPLLPPMPAISSGHKIFKLNEKIHFAAKKSMKL